MQGPGSDVLSWREGLPLLPKCLSGHQPQPLSSSGARQFVLAGSSTVGDPQRSSAGSWPLTQLDAARRLPTGRPKPAAFLKDLQRVITRIGYEMGRKNVSVGGQEFGHPRGEFRMAQSRCKKPLGAYLKVKDSHFPGHGPPDDPNARSSKVSRKILRLIRFFRPSEGNCDCVNRLCACRQTAQISAWTEHYWPSESSKDNLGGCVSQPLVLARSVPFSTARVRPLLSCSRGNRALACSQPWEKPAGTPMPQWQSPQAHSFAVAWALASYYRVRAPSDRGS